MAHRRRRKKKGAETSGASDQSAEAQGKSAELTEAEAEESKRFFIVLGVIFAIVILVFLALQVGAG